MVAVTLPWFVGGLIAVVLHFLSSPWIRLHKSGMSFVCGGYVLYTASIFLGIEFDLNCFFWGVGSRSNVLQDWGVRQSFSFYRQCRQRVLRSIWVI